MKTNQSKKEKSIDVTFSNDKIETNSQTLKISLPEQLKNVENLFLKRKKILTN